MRPRFIALLGTIFALMASAAAIAAVKPDPRTSFFYLGFGHFSITLDTISGTQIAAARPAPQGAQYPLSAVLVVCPKKTAAGRYQELHIGFPGATLKLIKGRYRFTRSYTEKNARLIVVGATTGPALKVAVKLTGTVTSTTRITGTVSVKATGCELKSTTYAAKYLRALPS